jgi:hypothetical protein
MPRRRGDQVGGPVLKVCTPTFPSRFILYGVCRVKSVRPLKKAASPTSGSQPLDFLEAHPPANFGGLFSIKAATPSLKSLVRPA